MGVPDAGSHDEIDLTILSAVKAECADYLVTDDGKLRKRARRVGLTARVLSAADAVQRQTWTVQHGGQYGGLCIVNPETPAPYALVGKTLKICTFKVARDCRGHRYGELLLKTVFEYLLKNDYQQVFVEAFEKHEDLLELLQDFGFAQVGTNARGELHVSGREGVWRDRGVLSVDGC